MTVPVIFTADFLCRRRQAMLTATSAGWALLVLRNSSSGPSKNIFRKGETDRVVGLFKQLFD